MWRGVLLSLVLICSPAEAQDISGAGEADGPLTTGAPSEIAATLPQYWALRDSVLINAVTRLGCPAALDTLPLRGTRQDAIGANCVWVNDDLRFGVWALSAVFGDDENPREDLLQVYDEGSRVPGNEVRLLQTRRVGDCTIDSHTIYRGERSFWVTAHEVWAPRTMHQIRNFTYDEADRDRVDAMSEQVLALSIASLCVGIS